MTDEIINKDNRNSDNSEEDINSTIDSLSNLLRVVVTGLVDSPTEIQITSSYDTSEIEKSLPRILFQLKVAENETGRVIGKQGRIAKSLRTLLRSAASFKNVSVRLDII